MHKKKQNDQLRREVQMTKKQLAAHRRKQEKVTELRKELHDADQVPKKNRGGGDGLVTLHI